MGRLGMLSVSRYKQQLSRGVLSAPLGFVTIAVVQAVGAQTLLAWNEQVRGGALRARASASVRSLRPLARLGL